MNDVDSSITSAQVMRWLHEVPDPEIPVISVVDLGIVRGVSFEGEACVVTITPTYSGCPAMREIEQDVISVLQGRGLRDVRVEMTLSPAWTTDWMSERGKEALKTYGIAPPMEQAVDVSGIMRRREAAVPCPQCDSPNTRLVSRFGSTACKALYRCQSCGEPFDYFKAH